MIRLLQQDNKTIKILFALIIGAAVISMVAYLIPGIGDTAGANDGTVFATVHDPGVLGRIFGESTPIKTTEVNQLAARQLQQQRLPDTLLPYMVPRAAQILVQRTILKHQADKMGLQVSDADLVRELKTGPFAQYLFPNGNYVGDDQYINFVQSAFQTSRSDFESEVKQDMELNRLQGLITGGVNVSDAAVREAYRVQGVKVKFDYAIISTDDIRKTINPSDADLQAFFKQNASRYTTAVPEQRKIQYAAFTAANLPGGKPAVTDADIQAYYNAHQDQYQVKEQVKTRHILITVPAGADAKTDAAAKAKAEGILQQIKAGGNFAELAGKNSDDPGSKDKGGELPMYPTAGLDPAYSKAAMALNPGQTSGLVRSQFGYHIIQTEEKQAAHLRPIAEVKAEIVPVLEQQKAGAAENNFANELTAAAKQQGLEKAAASKGLKVVTTDFIGKDAVIAGLADGTAVLTQAFTMAKGAAPASASTGDGFAVFQVADIQAAHAPDFATYKSHILDDYRDQQVPQLLTDQIIKLDGRAKVLNDLKKAAAEMKIPVKSSDFVDHSGQVPDVGSLAGPASVVFTLPKGSISSPVNLGRSAAVFSIVDTQEPSADEIAKNFNAMRDQLLGTQREEIFRVYIGSLTDKYTKAGSIRYAKKQSAPGSSPSPFGN